MVPEASTETTSSLMESASSAREEQEMSCGERELVCCRNPPIGIEGRLDVSEDISRLWSLVVTWSRAKGIGRKLKPLRENFWTHFRLIRLWRDVGSAIIWP